jgi:predicted ATPase
VIEKVSFRNFKAYRSLDVELEPFTVLVGPNASGKTTLLEGLARLCNVGAQESGDQGVDLNSLMALHVRAYGTTAPIELGIEGTWDGTGVSYRVTHDTDVEVVRTLEPSLEASLLATALRSTQILRFEPRRLTEASYSEEEIPRIHGDGGGLASVLAYLKLERDEVFHEIELALKQVVPAVRRIRIERASVEQTTLRTIALDEQHHQIPEKRSLWGHRIVLDMRGAKGVAASDAGEGTLMALGLLTVLMGTTKPRLVLLDDIELGLHPAAQGKLIEALRKLQQRDPELQIIATSHSPFILNYLDPKEVRMTFLAENGFARCEKLTAHPEFERWKDLMSPGEFWSTVGEAWLEKGEGGEAAPHE